MRFASGATVQAPDGRIGSLLEEEDGIWQVCLPLEQPHPDRPGRIVASTETVAIPEARLVLWTDEMEADLQIDQARRAAVAAEGAERVRLEQIRVDLDFAALLEQRRRR